MVFVRDCSLQYKIFYKEWILGLWLLLLVVPLWYWFIYVQAAVSTNMDPVFITQNHVRQFITSLAPAFLFISLIIVSIYRKTNVLSYK